MSKAMFKEFKKASSNGVVITLKTDSHTWITCFDYDNKIYGASISRDKDILDSRPQYEKQYSDTVSYDKAIKSILNNKGISIVDIDKSLTD